MSVTTAQAVTLLENILFESPTVATANAAAWVAQSQENSGQSTVAGLAAAMAATSEAGIVQQVVRYYMGALGRVPAGVEIQFYVTLAEAGLTASQIAQGASAVAGSEWAQIATYFGASPEFASDFGLTTAGQVTSANEVAVITAFYTNILGRVPAANEIAYYEGLLNSGTSVATLIQYFTESPENQTAVDTNIATALANYGASVANGTTPSTIPYVPVNVTLGASALTVTGLLNTTAVEVTGTAATAAQAAATAATGVIGVSAVTAATGVAGVTAVTAVTPVTGQSAVTAVTDGAVTINDSSSSATGAGVIASVTLADSGASSVINDNALTSLSLIGTTGTLAITNLNSAAISAHASTLALTVDGLSAAANTITDTNNEISTLNITTATADSVLAGFADTHLTTLTVTGTNALTLKTINSSLTSLTVSGGASFSDGAASHSGGLAALGAHLTITDSSSGTFSAALDDTTQTFTGGSGASTIIVSALADATKTINAGSATSGNELIFEGGGYVLTSASSGKFVNFQTVGVAANVTGTIDLSVIDATASALEVIGANAGITFSKVASGASLLLDPSSGAVVAVNYADSTGAKDSATVTMSSAVTALTLQDSLGVGIGTVSIVNNLAGTDTVVSAAHILGTFTDNALTTLNVSGSAALSITTLAETAASATTFTLNNGSTDGYGVTIGALSGTALATLAFSGTGTSAVTTLATGAASLAVSNGGTIMDYVGTITENLSALTLSANVALGQAATALTSNGLQDALTTGVSVSAGSDNAHVTVNLTSGAAASTTDNITLGNGNNVVVDASAAGTVNIKLGTGANLVELGATSLDTTALYNVTFATRTASSPNVVVVGADGTKYATAPNLVVTGATTGDIIDFGNDSLSSAATLTATSLTSATSAATAIAALEALATTAHEVVYGVYSGNTYIVETVSGTVGVTDTTVIELAGSQTLTASTGYVTIGSTASTLPSIGGLTGESDTIPAGVVTPVTLGAGANIVTLTGASVGITDTFTSIAATTQLTINYQATSGTDTINMNGSAGTSVSNITSLIVNDTSTTNAGLTIGAFTDNALTSVTYNNSGAITGVATVTQQALTSSSLNTINFTGGASSKPTNTYFFTGTLSTSGTLTVNDTNIGTGTATMGLTLTGGPSILTLNSSSPGTLAVGTLVDNNLATMNITGGGGGLTVGTLNDTIAATAGFTVNDSDGSSVTIALAGLSATPLLTINDSASASLTDSSAYSDGNLTTLTLDNTGAYALSIGTGGITAPALSTLNITGSGLGAITVGQLIVANSGSVASSLTINDTYATGGLYSYTTVPLSGLTAVTSLIIADSSTKNLNATDLDDSALTSLNLTNSGSAILVMGVVEVDSLNVFNVNLSSTGSISFTSIGDLTNGGVTVNYTSTSSNATTFTFTNVPNATSFTVNDNASAALTVSPITDNNATVLSYTNNGPATLTASVTDSATNVALTFGGTGSGGNALTLTDSAGTTLQISTSAAGTSTVTLGSSADLTSVAMADTGSGALTVTSVTSSTDSILTALSFSGGAAGTITTAFSATADTTDALTISDTDKGSVSLTGFLIGGAATNTNSLTVENANSGVGAITITSAGATDYLAGITVDNTSAGSISLTLVDGVTAAASVTLEGTGAEVVSLTDTVGQMHITQSVASVSATITLVYSGQSGDSISLANGTNTVILSDAPGTDTITLTLGTGTNAITMSSGHTVGNSIILNGGITALNTNTTPTTADSFNNFLLDSGTAAGDTLTLGTTNILTTASLDPTSHWAISTGGIMTNSNPTVLNFIAAVQAVTTAGVAAFHDSANNTWIAYTDGAHDVGVIELIGTTALGFETGTTYTTGYVHLS